MNRFFCAVFFSLLLSVCFTAAFAQDTTAPTISSVSTYPAMVAAGDRVHVTVWATDDTQVTSVTADSVPLEMTDVNRWEGDITANPLTGSHPVLVIASDAAQNSAMDATAGYLTAPVLGIRCDDALSLTTLSFTPTHLFKVWGRTTFIDPDSFWISDGRNRAVKVISPGHSVCSGDFVVAHGRLNPTAPPATISDASYQILKIAQREEISISNVTVGKDLMVSLNGYLPSPVDYGTKLHVTLTSTDAAKVRLSKASDVPGTSSIVLTVPGGSSSLPTFYVHGLDERGVVDVIATAPGCIGKVFKVTLAPSGFVIYSPSSITTTTFSNNTNINIRSARLDPGDHTYAIYQTLRPGINPVNVTLSSSDTSIGVITTSPVVLSGGMYNATTQFDPIGGGSATISISPVEGFTTPTDKQQITAIVDAPDISLSNVTVGRDLQTSTNCNLTVAPPEPVDMTVTVESPSVATITTNPAVEGSSSVTFTGVSTTSSRTFYIQGRSLGTTKIRVSAVGYDTVEKTITVDPSGFVIYSPNSISTTTHSGNTTVHIRSARLDPDTLKYSTYQNLRGGMEPVVINVSVDDPSVGILNVPSVTIQSNSYNASFEFDPIGGGSATISISPVESFTTPTDRQQITATVDAPDIYTYDVTVGRDLQTSTNCSLAVAPPEPVDMTVTVESPEVATITTDPAIEGTSSVTFTGVANANSRTFYVQGRSIGTTKIRVSAVGYDTIEKTITVEPSGFIIYSSNISTTYYSSPSAVQIRPARLDPDTLEYSTYQNLRAGMEPVNVSVAISDPSIGTLSAASVTIQANSNSASLSFTPAAVGSAVISISPVEGFTTPSNRQQITATVVAPNINASDVTVGRDLQTSTSCSLAVAPPAPVDMTVTVGASSIATITTDPAVEGTSNITFTGVTSTSSRTFYVQGRSLGTTTLRVQAAGYTTVEKTITVDPSGFVIYSPNSITTTASAGNTTLNIRPARLDPTTYTYSVYQNLRGGLSVSVEVVSSNQGVGVITSSPIVFGSNTYNVTTQFDPLAAGSCTVSVVPPPFFSTPTTRREIDVTVKP